MSLTPLGERYFHAYWWSTWMGAFPIFLLVIHATPSDWIRHAVHVLMTMILWLVSRKRVEVATLVHIVLAMLIVAWYFLDPTGAAFQRGLGVLGFASIAMLQVMALGLYFGPFGALIGAVVAGAGILGQAQTGQWSFAAMQVLMAAALGGVIHVLLVQLEATRQALTRAATVDELTNLGNRRALTTEFDRYESIAARRGVPLLITSWDVNDLKRINDSMGHAIGDAYLKRFSKALQSAARLEDAFFRVGGDEFVGLHLNLTHAPELIERVRAIFPDAAAGWAHTNNGLEVALIEADRLMYADKARSKADLVELFGPSGTTSNFSP
jgi:diguanylate cyclase (GGDEF)-like protein